jgi:hypothetical protein
MSRGPGRWQGAILEALQTRKCVWLWDIDPHASGRSARFVFRRAAQRLAEQGLVMVEKVGVLDICVTRRQNSTEVSHIGAPEVSVTYVQNSGAMSRLGVGEGPP